MLKINVRDFNLLELFLSWLLFVVVVVEVLCELIYIMMSFDKV